jgi:hypothetical protein
VCSTILPTFTWSPVFPNVPSHAHWAMYLPVARLLLVAYFMHTVYFVPLKPSDSPMNPPHAAFPPKTPNKCDFNLAQHCGQVPLSPLCSPSSLLSRDSQSPKCTVVHTLMFSTNMVIISTLKTMTAMLILSPPQYQYYGPVPICMYIVFHPSVPCPFVYLHDSSLFPLMTGTPDDLTATY